MAQTLDQINALRYLKGEEPLTELPAENPEIKEQGGAGKEETPEVIKEKEVEPNKETTPQGGEKPTVVNNQELEKGKEQKPVESIVPEPVELDDTAILEALKKRGINVNSFEELTPKETIDPEKAAEQREAAKLSFALNKGLYSKKEYESYIRDSNDLKNLVYGEFYKEAKAENAELTDQEIQESFLAEYGLDGEPESARYKRGVNTMAMLADKMLREKYDKIYETDKEFDKYESTEKSQKERQKNILSKAPSYKRDVEDAVKEVEKAIIPFDEKESFEATFSKEAIESVKSQLLNEAYSVGQIEKGWSKEELKEIAYTALLRANFTEIAKNIAEQYLYKNQKGTKGIPNGNQLQQPIASSQLTEKQKEALSYYYPEGAPVVAAN
jgi:hypothetical protein